MWQLAGVMTSKVLLISISGIQGLYYGKRQRAFIARS
jgi:hypothetical protein